MYLLFLRDIKNAISSTLLYNVHRWKVLLYNRVGTRYTFSCGAYMYKVYIDAALFFCTFILLHVRILLQAYR